MVQGHHTREADGNRAGAPDPLPKVSLTPGGHPPSYCGQGKQKHAGTDSGHIFKKSKRKQVIPDFYPS